VKKKSYSIYNVIKSCSVVSIFISLFIIFCSLPSNPINDYDKAKLEILNTTNNFLPSNSVNDTLTLNIRLALPHLFGSLKISLNSFDTTIQIESGEIPADTITFKRQLLSPDTLYINVVGNLKNNTQISSSVRAIVRGLPPKVTQNPPLLTYISSGTSLSVSILAEGSAPLSYQWYHNDRIVAGQATNIFKINSFQRADSGKYVCFVSNAWGKDSCTPAIILHRDTTSQQLYWNKDTLSDSLTEGDSLLIVLKDHYTNKTSKKVSISLLGSNLTNVTVVDSLLKVKTGPRDSGQLQLGLILKTDNEMAVATIIINVKPRFYLLNCKSDSGTVVLQPSLQKYRWKDTVFIKAVPSANFFFYQWDGDLTGNIDTIKVVIDRDMDILARFWPIRSLDCEKVTDSNLQAAIKKFSTGSNRPIKLCGDPGLYNNNAVRLNGKIVTILQK
jgi:hypothetical protein